MWVIKYYGSSALLLLLLPPFSPSEKETKQKKILFIYAH